MEVSDNNHKINAQEIKEVLSRAFDFCYVPASVYRLQFNPAFQFNNAVEFIPYLKQLGIDALYCSPYFQAIPGSPHGYNVTDPNKINPELGSDGDYDIFCSVLEQNGIGQIIDIVPNHMGVLGNTNHLWQDLLENGPASRYARFFDVDWNPVTSKLKNKVLVPVLGEQFGRVLEQQEIQLYYNNGEFFFQYWSRRFPLAPKTYPEILQYQFDELEAQFSAEDEDFLEYNSIITAFNNLPDRIEVEHEKVLERAREKEIAKQRLRTLLDRSEPLRSAVRARITLFNGVKGMPQSFDLLQALLDKQCYRLAFWCVAGEEINYRRFFDVNELAAIRMEDREVFEYYHKLIFRLLREKRVHGLRIDHSDGLYDPSGYFKALQYHYLFDFVSRELEQRYGPFAKKEKQLLERELANVDLQKGLPLYVVIEKILDRKEALPDGWHVHGTVGYDFLNALNGLFIYRHSEKEFSNIYQKFTGHTTDFDELFYQQKRFFAKVHMSGEINTLAYRLYQIAEKNRNYRDFTLNGLISAIREVIACFPVYRTYIAPDATEVDETDARFVNIALKKAQGRDKTLGKDLYDFIGDVLLLRFDDEVGKEERELYRDFVLRFQQITSPIMAKGVEDTAFYISNRFISLNEVGGNPGYFGYSVHEFNKQNIERQRHWPASFITSSTHDTKRSEDVRMRLNVLSEMPELWKRNIVRWSQLNKKHKTVLNQQLQPDRNTEYFIYQTLIGVWPDYVIEGDYSQQFVERIWGYMQKSIREAKTFTSWTAPDVEYEACVKRFVEGILDTKKKNYFLSYFKEFQAAVASYGQYNSLSALVLKAGSPGVADFYQGTELWNYKLVDPDNRQLVDFNLRRHLLHRVALLNEGTQNLEQELSRLLLEKRDSRIKIYTLSRLLHWRRVEKELFVGGDYIPLEVEGEHASKLVAFLRRAGSKCALVVAARFFYQLLGESDRLPVGEEVWSDTSFLLPAEYEGLSFRDIFTYKEFSAHHAGEASYFYAGELFSVFSFAVLIGELEH